MKLTLLGGGGFRVPLVFRALLRDTSASRVSELRLYDTDPVRLDAMRRVVDDLAALHGDPPRLVATTDIGEALDDTDFVFSAIRVGGTGGRALDEQLCLHHDVIGQEKVGAGGISYALRGIPQTLRLADSIAEHAPQAWVINFTNPAGVLTQVLRERLGGRVIGICDSPVGLARRVLRVLQDADLCEPGIGPVGAGAERIALDYSGLNHLGWLRGLRVDGVDLLPLLLERPDLIEGFEEGRLFGAPLVQALASVPNEYLHYYYFQRENLAADLASAEPRGRFLARQQAEFYARVGACRAGEAWPLWDATRREREVTYMASNREVSGSFERDDEDLESGGYDQVALAIMHAIANRVTAQLVLNVPNGGCIPELGPTDIIEVPCRVDGDGVRPLPVTPLPDHARGLVVNAKYVEHMTISAGMEHSRRYAELALLQHPLVDSWSVARELLDDMIDTFPELVYLR